VKGTFTPKLSNMLGTHVGAHGGGPGPNAVRPYVARATCCRLSLCHASGRCQFSG
jgi:hypothetical protein